MSHLILCGRNVWNNSLERGVSTSVSGDLEPSQSNMESQRVGVKFTQSNRWTQNSR